MSTGTTMASLLRRTMNEAANGCSFSRYRNALFKSTFISSSYQACPGRSCGMATISPGPWAKHGIDSFPPPISQGPAGKPAISTAYIAIGSNVGDRVAMIEQACKRMRASGIHVKRTSCLWESEPMYVLEQPKFLNGVCEIETSLPPLALLDQLQSIERDMRRQKLVDKGPRNIDLDILIYGAESQLYEHERLKIPHPLMCEREFVLRPLAELAPGQALDPRKPWRVTLDYLNALETSKELMTTVTPLRSGTSDGFLRPLKQTRPTLIMGILNMTPDSLSGSVIGKDDMHAMSEAAIMEAVRSRNMQDASIIDIGGQSTRPNAQTLSVSAEMDRIRLAVPLLRKAYPEKPLSVDTFYALVARESIELGADIINDISGGLFDADMLPTVSELGKTIVLMHTRGTPTTMTSTEHTSYPEGLIPTIAQELLARVAAAEAAGIPRWRIILDPGIGFAKTAPQNVEILRRLDELRDWEGLRGLPWLVGSSNKRFIGRYAGLGMTASASERSWGTAATVAAAVQGGADIVRVHDVKEMGMVVGVSHAIWRP